MKRTPIVVLGIATITGYMAVAVLAAVVIRQQSELHSIETKLAQSTHATPPDVSPTPLAFARPTKVTDNLGHTWVYAVPGNPVVQLPAGTNLTFTAFAHDAFFLSGLPNPQDRPVEYAYTVLTIPAHTETVLCNWGAPFCSWTAPATPQEILVRAYFRVVAGPHRYLTCAPVIQCDDSIALDFEIVGSAGSAT